MVKPELTHQVLGTLAVNAFASTNSGSRSQMTGQHVQQVLEVMGAQPRQIITGAERSLAQHAHCIKMPGNARVIEVINRMAPGISDAPGQVIGQVIVYEDQDSREVGMVQLTNWASHNGYYAFGYVPGEAASDIRQGAFIEKDSVLMRCRSVSSDGEALYGFQANTAFMTVPEVSEDALWVSESFLEKAKYHTLERIKVTWGDSSIPLNVYGDEKNYQIFPEVGQRINKEGLLMVLRKRTDTDSGAEWLTGISPVTLSDKATRTVDYCTDRKYCAYPGAQVVDVEIYHDSQRHSYTNMDEQPNRYLASSRAFAQRVVTLHNSLMAQSNNRVRWSPEMNSLILACMTTLAPDRGADRVTRVYKQTPIGPWTAWITVLAEHKPGMGSKFTDMCGGKGVVSKITPDADMPRDMFGRVAHIVGDPIGTFNRMNPGRVYEPYIVDAATNCYRQILEVTGIAAATPAAIAKMRLNPASALQGFSRWLKFHALINPMIQMWYDEGKIGKDPVDFIATVIEHGVRVLVRGDNELTPPEMVRAVEGSEFAPPVGPVTYRDGDGRMATTDEPVRIAGTYIIMLNKTARETSAVGFPRQHPMGTSAVLTSGDAAAAPYRPMPPRTMGEAECRGIAANGVNDAGEEFVAEIMSRNNDPIVVRAMAEAILTADQPGNIDELVDRTKFGYSPRPIKAVRHMINCSGLDFEYQPYEES